MREQFRHTAYTPEQQLLLIHSNMAIARHTAVGIPITVNQLYQLMLDETLLDPKVSFKSYQRLIHGGLYSGYIDWDLTPNHPVSFSTVPDEARQELWCTAPGLDNWLFNTFEIRSTRVCCGHSRHWWPHHLYAGVNRLYRLLEQAEPVQLYYLSGTDSYDDRVFNRWQTRLSSMIAVRRTRQVFNKLMGRDMWQPEGMTGRPKQGTGNGLRNRIAMLLREEREYVADLLKVHKLCLETDARGSLKVMSPLELNNILSVAFQGRGTRST